MPPLPQDVGALLLDCMASLFCASCRDARRSGEARPRRRSSRSRSAPGAILQARCPCALPKRRGCQRAAPQPGATACRRPEAWAHSCLSGDAAPASGSQSMAPPQISPPPHGNSSRHQSLPEDANANPSIEVGPSMPASFTSTDSESEISPGGNPLRDPLRSKSAL